MQKQIRAAVHAAMDGSRKLRLVFRPEAWNGVGCLLGMGLGRYVTLSFTDETRLLAIAQSNQWPENGNRPITVTIGERFNVNWFATCMEYALESIEAA